MWITGSGTGRHQIADRVLGIPPPTICQKVAGSWISPTILTPSSRSRNLLLRLQPPITLRDPTQFSKIGHLESISGSKTLVTCPVTTIKVKKKLIFPRWVTRSMTKMIVKTLTFCSRELKHIKNWRGTASGRWIIWLSRVMGGMFMMNYATSSTFLITNTQINWQCSSSRTSNFRTSWPGSINWAQPGSVSLILMSADAKSLLCSNYRNKTSS